MASGVGAAPSLPVPKWLRRRVAVWQKRAQLDDWDIELVFKRGLKKVVAKTEWSPGYHAAIMTWSKERYDELGEAEADRVICHELYHLFNAKLDDELTDYIGRERVYQQFVKQDETNADKFAKILTRAYSRKRES